MVEMFCPSEMLHFRANLGVKHSEKRKNNLGGKKAEG